MMKKIVALLFFFIFSPNMIAAPISEQYIINYDSGYSFKIVINDNTITWTALDGPDKGKSETDNLTHARLNDSITVYQWTEKDGTFVTLALDRTLFKTVSSGKFSDGTWLWTGNAKRI